MSNNSFFRYKGYNYSIMRSPKKYVYIVCKIKVRKVNGVKIIRFVDYRKVKTKLGLDAIKNAVEEGMYNSFKKLKKREFKGRWQ